MRKDTTKTNDKMLSTNRMFSIAVVSGTFFGPITSPAQTPQQSLSMGSWTQRNAVGYAQITVPEIMPRAGAAAFVIGGKVYVTGGDANTRLLSDLWAFDPATGTWTQRADLPGAARIYASAFAVGGKGYVCSGATSLFARGGGTFDVVKDLWCYDPGTNSWAAKADLPGTARHSAVGLSIGSKGYMTTGMLSGGATTRENWEYDPAMNAWTKRADYGGSARSAAAGFTLGTKGYVCAGSADAQCWSYDPATNAWVRIADLATTSRNYAVGFAVAGKGAIGCGTLAGTTTPLKDLRRYDLATNTWSTAADVGTDGRTAAVAFVVSNKGYIACGLRNPSQLDATFLSDIWEYDHTNDRFSVKSPFSGKARRGAASFSVAGKGYVCAGEKGELRKDLWCYDPATDAWSQKADLAGGARIGAVGFSSATKGFILGGSNGTRLSDLWCYDPATNQWTIKAAMPGEARMNACSFTVAGKTYVCGGRGATSDKKDLWCYDPVTNVWTSKADLAGTARSQAVAFAIGSKGYVTTGASGSESSSGLSRVAPLKDLWCYDPTNNSWTQKADYANVACYGAAGFGFSDRGYVVDCGTAGNTTWAYVPATNSWSKMWAFPGTARAGAVALSIDGYAYLGTGSADRQVLNDWWRYTPPIQVAGGGVLQTN